MVESSSNEASPYKDVEQLSRNKVAVVPGRVTDVRGRFNIEFDLEWPTNSSKVLLRGLSSSAKSRDVLSASLVT